jgi:hypothetical protein
MTGGRIPSGVVLVALAALAAPPAVPAQCLQGLRLATKGEREFRVQTLGALESVLPPAPAGWRVAERTEVRAMPKICIGREREPLSLDYTIRYVRTAAGPASTNDDPSDARLVRTATIPPRPATTAAEVRLLVIVNARRELLELGAERMPMSETAAAFRTRTPASRAAQLILFLGDWTVFTPDDPAEAVEAMAHFDPGQPHTSVQSLALQLDGPRASIDGLLSALDVKALGELLSR